MVQAAFVPDVRPKTAGHASRALRATGSHRRMAAGSDAALAAATVFSIAATRSRRACVHMR